MPTYQEAGNLRALLPALLALEIDPLILVVDDASPDGTGRVAEEFGATDPRVRVLHRPRKEGLGPAYREGLAHALELGRPSVVHMDADLSHDPADVPRLVAALAEADLVVGSRYVDGVRVINWPLSRLLLSVTANGYVRRVTGLGVRDCTSGFRAWRAETLGGVLTRSRASGYAFLVETLFLAWRQGARVREEPIVFTERRSGRSNLSRSAVVESLWVPWRLRLGRAAPRPGQLAGRADYSR